MIHCIILGLAGIVQSSSGSDDIQVVLLGVKPAVVTRVGEQLAGAGQGGQH